MACQKCGSKRILSFYGKCSDLFNGEIGDKSYDGYVPDDLGIGGGDVVQGNVCLDCGQLQGQWPRPETQIETMPPQRNRY